MPRPRLRASGDKNVDRVASAVYRRLDYLNLDSDSVVSFARDLHQYRKGTEAKKLAKLKGKKRSKLVNQLVSRFLLSSDFFENGEDEEKLVRYTRLYDPYLNPCYNPLALL